MSNNTLAPSAVVTSRDPKGRKFMSIVEQAYDKAQLPPEQAQLVNDTRGLGDHVSDWIERNRYAGDEKSCKYGYRFVDLDTQLKRLWSIFGCHGGVDQELLSGINDGKVKLPEGAERWFAIPNWTKIGGVFGGDYLSAIKGMLILLRANMLDRFCCYLDRVSGQLLIRQTRRSERAWLEIIDQQKNPSILIVPCQFGHGRYGSESCDSSEEINKIPESEFCLGAFALGAMLLNHPDRMINKTRPNMYCVGDEICKPDGDWGRNSLAYLYSGRQLKLGDCPVFLYNNLNLL